MKIVENETEGMDVVRLNDIEQIFRILQSGRIDIGIMGKVDVMIAKKQRNLRS